MSPSDCRKTKMEVTHHDRACLLQALPSSGRHAAHEFFMNAHKTIHKQRNITAETHGDPNGHLDFILSIFTPPTVLVG